LFGALALILASIGIYGVLAYSVSAGELVKSGSHGVGRATTSGGGLVLKQAHAPGGYWRDCGILVALPVARMAAGLLYA